MTLDHTGVLIVEDDAATAALERRVLARAGVATRTAAGVREALALLERQSFAAILLDYNLPDGDPWAVVAAADAKAPRIPVVLVTAQGSEQIATEALHRGVADYVKKTDAFWDELPGILARVTRAVKTEDGLRLLNDFFEGTHVGAAVVAPNGTLERVNRAFTELYGGTAAELVGTPFADLCATEWRARLPALMRDIEATGRLRFEAEHRRKDGTEFPVIVDATVVRDHGGSFAHIGILVLDITDRKRAEGELHRRNEELEQFAYAASHDLKEPLRGIHNYARFLSDDYADCLDAPGQQRLQALMRLTERMEGLIDSLLQFSRAGQAELTQTTTDLSVVLADVLDSLAATLAERSVEVRVPAPLPVVRCDPLGVGQVLHHLLANAVKYSDKDHKWVEIGWHSAAGELIFQVRDNGIGIPAQHQQAIFRIFKRLHGRDKYGGGSGVGLALVKKIVERHGGRIWVESEPGVGSTFYFTLNAQVRPA